MGFFAAGAFSVNTVPNPGLANQDVIIAGFFNTPLSVPGDWTLISSVARPNSQGTGAWYFHIAGPSEPSTYNFGGGGSGGVYTSYTGEVLTLGTLQTASDTTNNPASLVLGSQTNVVNNRRVVYYGTARWYGTDGGGGGIGPTTLTLDAAVNQRATRQIPSPGLLQRDVVTIGDELVASGNLPSRTSVAKTALTGHSANPVVSSVVVRLGATVGCPECPECPDPDFWGAFN